MSKDVMSDEREWSDEDLPVFNEILSRIGPMIRLAVSTIDGEELETLRRALKAHEEEQGRISAMLPWLISVGANPDDDEARVSSRINAPVYEAFVNLVDAVNESDRKKREAAAGL